jgi:hypothetical protein
VVLNAYTLESNYDVFLSYNSADHGVVEDIARKLRDDGLEPFLDRWYLAPGMRWRSELERTLGSCKAVAIFVGPSEMGSWQQREIDVALDLQSRNPNLPVIPVLLPGCEPPLGFLRQLTWVDLRAQKHDPGIAILANAVRGKASGPDLQKHFNSVRDSICPYRGLLHFREEDAPFFFGREAAIDKLMDSLKLQPFVAVVGASGSGKSSVVRAGLVPRLRSDRDTVWEIVLLVPTDQPLRSLAMALIPLLDPTLSEVDRLAEASKLTEHFSSKRVSVRDVIRRILDRQSGTDRVLIVVDQFEELYTLTSVDSVRRLFLDELLAASSNLESRITVAITLRGDFVGKAFTYRALSDRLQDAQINLGPMTREELESAIRKPAEKMQFEFEAGLVWRILDAVGDQPGNLPLLEFALEELWENRRGRILLNESYDDMGELKGALAKKAGDFFVQLSLADQKVLQRVFLRIVRPSESGEDTRRRAAFTELPSEGAELVFKLANERLLVTSKSANGAEQTVEVAHEALISNWGTLRSWINEDREFLLWRERFGAFLAEWQRVEKNEDGLLRGPLLTEAQKWFDRRSQDLSEQERAFIATGRAVRDRLARDERERQEREVESVRKLAQIERRRSELESRELQRVRQRQRHWNVALLGLLFVAVLGFAGSAFEVHLAHIKAKNAVIQKYAEAGQYRLGNGHYMEAAVYFAAAYKLVENTSAMTELLQKGLLDCSIAVLAKQTMKLEGHKHWVSSAVFSSDGQNVVTASWDKTIRVWNTETGASKIIAQSRGRLLSVNLSPDGTRIVSGCWDGYAYVWNFDGHLLATLDGHRGRVNYAAFSPDGLRIVTASDDYTARVWTTDGKPLFSMNGHTDGVKSAVYSPDGKTILTCGFDGTAKIWDSASGQVLRTIDGTQEGQTDLTFASFSPDGKHVATAGLGPEVIIWDLDGHKVSSFRFFQGRVNYVQFNHSGTLIAAASDEDYAKVWDIAHDRLWMSLQHHKGRVLCAIFSPHDNQLLTTGEDKTVRIWETSLRKVNFSGLVTMIEKESPWKIVDGQLQEK